MENGLQYLKDLSAWIVFLAFLLLNIGIFIFSMTIGNFLEKKFEHRRVNVKIPVYSVSEIVFTTVTILFNALTTLAGWFLWKLDLIEINTNFDGFVIIDSVVLFLVMDLFMYLLHRLAHQKFLYKILHQTHHSFKFVKTINLFVLNPLENMSFGLLWLMVLCVYSTSWFAISAYLTFNLIFGIIGHLGVEPMNDRSQKNVILSIFTTSSFHSFHHQDEKYNFGFYTVLWDKLFKTIAPYYYTSFGKIPSIIN